MQLQEADLKAIFNMPPEQAIAYLKVKGVRVPADWRQMDRLAHDSAFMIAKMTKVDLLSDVQEALVDALKNGTDLKTFIDRVAPQMMAKGWWGTQEFINPSTGEIKNEAVGSAYRLQTIFETNMQVAYGRGRQAVFNQVTNTQPYWQWVHIPQARPRPAHLVMDGKIFRHDDPFWGAFSLPCGYRCKCRMVALTDREVQRDWGGKVETGAGRIEQVTSTHKDRATGEKYTVTRPSYQLPNSNTTLTPDIGFQAGGTPMERLQKIYLDKIDAAPAAIRKQAEGNQ